MTTHQLKQRTFGIISIVSSMATILFFITFAFLHDNNAPLGVQACLLVATGIALMMSIMALLIGTES